MCGIAGIFDHRGRRPVDRDLLGRMTATLFHRGPDEGGLHTEPGVGLGHRRLSIIDLGGGHQPLFNEDGSVAVVFNGEIYNFRGLVDELKAAGHVFKTHSDTEVIVHGWEEWGEHCVDRFRGMFAFAVWDRGRDCLFLARDRLGIKPLYYAALPDGRVTFASELKALLVDPALPREIDPRSVEDYFAYGYVPEPRSIFRHAFKLSPGHTLLVRRDGAPLVQRRYWDLHFSSEPLAPAAGQAVEEAVVEHLQDAVSSHLVSDVPVGAFLSGGVDSSAVVAMMARVVDDPVRTVSIGFGDPRFNEAHYAAQVAERYHTDHQLREVNPDDFGLLDRLARLYDEPYADSSAMPTYRVCELARQRVKVALSGDGGDEAFAGYRRYQWHLKEEQVRGVLPLGLRRNVFGALGWAYPKLDWAPRFLRAKATFQALGRDSVEGYFHSVSLVSAWQRQSLFSRAFQRELQGYEAVQVLRDHAVNGPDHPLSRVQYLDFKTYLPGDILTKVDRASMAHSLEVRVPVLDHRFVEWAASLPPSLKLSGGEGKYVLKRALEPYLPRDVLYRKKMGFAVPLASWFRGPLRDKLRDAVLGDTLADTGIFDQRTLKALVERHQSGARDHSAILWSLLMFERFVSGVMEGQSGMAPSVRPAAMESA